MENNSFLKKHKGHTEVNGHRGIPPFMNKAHTNENDYLLMNKKKNNSINQRKREKNEYTYIKSESSKELNENKNFIPQKYKLSMSLKVNPRINKENDKSINKKNFLENNIIKDNNQKRIQSKNNKNININESKKFSNNENRKKANYYSNNEEAKIKGMEYKNKSLDKPIKIFNHLEQNKNKNLTNNAQNISKSPKKEEKKNFMKNKNNSKIDYDISTNKQSKDKNKKKKMLQILSQNPSFGSIKSKSKDLLIKSSDRRFLKSYDRINTYTPNFRKNNKNQSLKEIISNRLKLKNKKENNNMFQNNSYNLPNIYINKSIPNSPQKIRNEYNKRQKINMENLNQNVINNIKYDFLLDSIKNRGKNKYLNKNFTDRDLPNNKLNKQMKIDKNLIFNSNNQNINIMRNNNNNIINKRYPYDKNNENLYDNKNYYNINKNGNNLGNGGRKKPQPHLSFNSPPILPRLKNKLDIINEEGNDKNNKYITDTNINKFEDEENLNDLEILMKQRRLYQKKIPKNSRFKLKQISLENYQW